MKIKMEKILPIVFIVVYLVLISGNAFAAVSDFKGEINPEGTSTITTIISSILAIVRTIGVGIAIIILMIIGCKYMLASAGERAEIKKYAVHYIIGAIVLFAGSVLISIIKNFVDTSMQ